MSKVLKTSFLVRSRVDLIFVPIIAYRESMPKFYDENCKGRGGKEMGREKREVEKSTAGLEGCHGRESE